MTVRAILHIFVEPGKIEDVGEALARIPEIIDIYEVTGEYDIIATAKANYAPLCGARYPATEGKIIQFISDRIRFIGVISYALARLQLDMESSQLRKGLYCCRVATG